jgi:hypothetical protein
MVVGCAGVPERVAVTGACRSFPTTSGLLRLSREAATVSSNCRAASGSAKPGGTPRLISSLPAARGWKTKAALLSPGLNFTCAGLTTPTFGSESVMGTVSAGAPARRTCFPPPDAATVSTALSGKAGESVVREVV